jgi:type I restriction enzyme, S subunit
MIAGLNPYPAMKDSGVPWLGAVPEHWDVRRIRNVAELRVSSIDKISRDGESPVRLCNYVDVYKHDRIRPGMQFMHATASLADMERFRLNAGDVLITKDSETWSDIGVPALVESAANDLVSGYHLAILRPRQDLLCSEFLFRALQSTSVAYQFHVEATGVTRYGLSHSAVKGARLPLPPMSEQTAIVGYLDHVDRRIRKYIRAKQKLIKLLEQQKQAIIHRAVTRGLDPNVRLKPSGIPWLGDVPSHWTTRQLGTLARIGNGSTPSRGNAAYWSGGSFPWLNSSCANQEVTDRSDQFVTEAALRECHLPIVPPGSVLVAITGQGRTRGKASLLRAEATINQHLVFITPRLGTVAPGFLRLALHAAYEQLRAMSDASGSTRGALTCGDLKHFTVPIPPHDEQVSIVASIDAETGILNCVLGKTDSETELLQEYRTRLIADVVTGKLDVREAAARLPEEIDDAEASAEAEDIEDTEEGVDDDSGSSEEEPPA